MKLSVATRDRIRALGGETYEDTIVEALDLLEAEVPFPLRIQIDDGVSAVDLTRSLPVGRILDHTGRAPAEAVRAARQALLHITSPASLARR